MKTLRDWLTTNKIVFETLAAFLLSIMAIVLSVAQTVTSFRQTQLSDFQTQIAEAQALPQFEIAIDRRTAAPQTMLANLRVDELLSRALRDGVGQP